ncbi:MAG: hypothetical protein OI715_00220 (plasmid) [Candidatus Methanoperedens sp.]|nr:MAG: hypothetical protein OI715_00220 [Candidatus Methanoperedens sp.]
MSDETDFHKLKTIMAILKEKHPDRISWMNRSAKRLSDVKIINNNESWLVKGIPPKDTQPWYIIRRIEEGIICSCYHHSFGKMRELRMCTHTGAVLLFRYFKTGDNNELIKEIEESEKLQTRIHFRRVAARTIAEKFRRSRKIIMESMDMVPDVQPVEKDVWKVRGFTVRMIEGKYICIGPSDMDQFPCVHTFAVMISRREKNFAARI